MLTWRYNFTFLFSVGFLLAASPDWIKFPHQFHIEDVELECDYCHQTVARSVDTHDRLLPGMDVCSDCHEDDTDDGDCSICHGDPDDPQTHRPRSRTLGPAFSHQFHLLRVGNCENCHGYILTDDSPEPSKGWKYNDCRQCHSNTQPEDHLFNWIGEHGLGINPVAQERCNVCHTSTSCDQCHQLQQFEPRVHPSDYILSHSFYARSNVLECSTCHDSNNDCYRCHRQNLVMPMNHNFPNWVMSNPASNSGGLHSDEALDEPDICQVCHLPSSLQSTCQRSGCHVVN